MFQNSAHDSICGCSADEVSAQVLVRYAEAEQIGRELAERAVARIAAAVPQTLAANAWRSELGASWHAVADGRDNAPSLCQHCHGAPGMVTAFADAPFTSPELDELLREGGKFVWAAGPA